MSRDPERDGSNPRPTAPAGVLGGPGKRAESAPVETAAKVPKSVFAQTIVGLQVPGATPVASPAAPPAPEQAEPLRDPSDRPAPVPYKRAHGAWGGTMPMPEPSPPAGNQSRERMIATKPGAGSQESSSVAVRPAAVIGTPEGREPTVRMPTTASSPVPSAQRPSSRPLPAPPPPSGAPPAMPSQNASAASASPRPQAPVMRAPEAKRDDPSVPRLSLGVEKIPSQEPATKVELIGQSQPLQLALDARDHVETSLRPESALPRRSMTPWIALAVIAVLGGLAFAFMGGSDDAPAPVVPERVEAVPAAAPTTPTTPTPSTEAAAQAAVPAAPSVPVTPPAHVVAPKPAAPAPSAVKPVKQAEEVKEAAKPVAKRKARRTKRAAATSSDGPVLKVTPQGDDLEAAARAAERFAEPEEDLEPSEPPAAEPPSPDEE